MGEGEGGGRRGKAEGGGRRGEGEGESFPSISQHMERNSGVPYKVWDLKYFFMKRGILC